MNYFKNNLISIYDDRIINISLDDMEYIGGCNDIYGSIKYINNFNNDYMVVDN